MGNEESTLAIGENRENETQEQTSRRSRRQRRHNQIQRNAPTNEDDNSWWKDIENENITLDRPPLELTSLKLNENVKSIEKDLRKKLLNENLDKNYKICIQEQRNGTDNVNIKRNTAIENENENLDAQADIAHRTERAAAREQSLEEFREELRQKRLARQTAVQDLRDEIAMLRKQLASQQEMNCPKQEAVNSLTDDTMDVEAGSSINSNLDGMSEETASCGLDLDDIDPMSRGRHANIELANAQLALQLANSENISLRAELGVVQKQVGTLKEVISCCKQMLAVKEEQCNELKGKLTEIETSFGEREMKIMSDNLRHEYERQLGNIRQLRELYEERQRISAAEQENLQRLISIKKDELLAEQEKTKNFEERNQTLIKEVESANNELATLREECNEHKFEKKALKEEMGAVNTLFSQMVMGFNGKNNLDIDRLTTMLEENRTLLNDMATKEVSCSDGATLPKLLFELVEQATFNGMKSSRSSTPIFEETPNASEDDTFSIMKDNEQHTHHNEIVTTDLSNDVDVAIENVIVVASADTMDDAMATIRYSSSETPATGMEQLNIATMTAGEDCGMCNKKSSKKQQACCNGSCKVKLPTATSSSVVAAAATAASTMKFHEPEVIGKVASAQEIIGNLPKVWKVLMELLSHHSIKQVQFEENGSNEDCYKSIETPNGPKTELSVSKTYIKLKDLILEKKFLVKETNRLKTLNSHLEYRLNAQEKRLSTVSLELTKTWHLVGKMQRQHRQLHTQEQILRYQLQQKRRLLSELKEELEYCRRKWAAARAKNDESQEQCNDLRREFARRKLEDANNSAESGYSDSGQPSDEEERAGAVGGSVNSRRKYLREMFEHTRKIKRMQSTSPGRAAASKAATPITATTTETSIVPSDGSSGSNSNNITRETEIVLRWNSAPPTCGWRRRRTNSADGNNDDIDGEDEEQEEEEEEGEELPPRLLARPKNDNNNKGAVPKQLAENNDVSETESGSSTSQNNSERATRIQRLEEQCKSLIQQVLETSDNRERLEIQLCKFQDEIAPVQYAVPLEEFIKRRRNERMSRASSAPATGTLTAREEEYTRKRSERLERLEEESRQLMSRIKRTSDRGHYLRCSLDRIRRAPSREDSFDSSVEDDLKKNTNEPNIAASQDDQCIEQSPLTAQEEAFTARRTARLRRLEEEGQQLLTTLSHNADRGNRLESKLDNLHERYGPGDKRKDEAETNLPSIDSNSSGLSVEQRLECIDQVSANRSERLRLLEEEGNQLIARLSNTSARGTHMINRIAEREKRQEKLANATANGRETFADTISKEDRKNVNESSTLLPTLKNPACSSFVNDGAAESIAVTTIPNQLATRELGAIPKSKPTSQLCAARHKSQRYAIEKKENENAAGATSAGETLEDMVKRLRDTPYPLDEVSIEDQQDTELNKNINERNENKSKDDESEENSNKDTN